MLIGRERRSRRVVLTKKLQRAHAQSLCDQLDSYGIGHELADDQGLFVVWVRRSDLALARALTGIAGVEPVAPQGSPRALLLRRAAILPLLVACPVAFVTWWSSPQEQGVASVEGYRANVFHADDDHDGHVDRMVVFGADGKPTTVLQDRDGDGLMDRFLRIEPERVVEFIDRDGDGFPEPAQP